MDKLEKLTTPSKACEFCELSDIDEFKYGPMFARKDIVGHYYCILFCSKLLQKGADDDGILGFRIEDIKAELRRAKKVLCAYCQKYKASIYCSHDGCKLKFHYPCGVARGSFHRFRDEYKSYCYSHRPQPKIPEEALRAAKEGPVCCPICYDSVDYTSKTDSIWAKCCSKAWYHRYCLQKHALSSGYFFKCSNCNNNSEFRKWAIDQGVFVPEEDGFWSLELEAFREMSHQYCKCDVLECKCPQGREFNESDTKWEIVLCKLCGSHGIHVKCGNLDTSCLEWECEVCSSAAKSYFNKKKIRKRKRAEIDAVSSPEKNKKRRNLRAIRKGIESENNSKTEKGSGRKLQTDKAISGEAVIVNWNSNVLQKNKEKAAAKEDTECAQSSANSDDVEEEIDVVYVTSDGDSSNDSSGPAKGSERRENDEKSAGMEMSSIVTEEDITNAEEVYKDFQKRDMKYHVKKEIYVISDDESDGSEIEVVLEKRNKKNKKGFFRTCSEAHHSGSVSRTWHTVLGNGGSVDSKRASSLSVTVSLETVDHLMFRNNSLARENRIVEVEEDSSPESSDMDGGRKTCRSRALEGRERELKSAGKRPMENANSRTMCHRIIQNSGTTVGNSSIKNGMKDGVSILLERCPPEVVKLDKPKASSKLVVEESGESKKAERSVRSFRRSLGIRERAIGCRMRRTLLNCTLPALVNIQKEMGRFEKDIENLIRLYSRRGAEPHSESINGNPVGGGEEASSGDCRVAESSGPRKEPEREEASASSSRGTEVNLKLLKVLNNKKNKLGWRKPNSSSRDYLAVEAEIIDVE